MKALALNVRAGSIRKETHGGQRLVSKQIDDQQSTVSKDGVVLRYTGVEYGRVMLLYKCSIMVVVIKRDSKSLGSVTEYCVSTWSFSSHV